MNLYYNTTAQCRVDENNTRITAKPVIHYGACPTWDLHFFSGNPSETPEPVDLSDIVSWRAAVDSDWNSNTEPMCRTLDENIDATQAAAGIISVPVNTNTQRYLTVVDGKQSVDGWFELRGFNDQGNVTLAVLLNITCSNSIDPTGGAEPELVDNDTAAMTWVKAVVAQQLYFQYSADGSNWHNPPMIPETDVYFRVRHGENGTPSAAQLIPYGPEGKLEGSFITFSSVTNNTVTFAGTETLPFGVLTNAGHFYPIEKGSLTIDPVNDTFTVDVTPYLAYDNVSTFSGTWRVYFSAGNSDPGEDIAVLTSTAVTPKQGAVYVHTLADNDAITISTTGLSASKKITFELHLIQPSTAVTFTLPASLIWEDASNYDSSNQEPDMSTADTLYCLEICWDGSDLLAKLKYTKTIETSGVE